MEIKILRLVSLAKKAGQITHGSFLTEKAIRDGRAKVVLMARNTGENTRKNITNLCTRFSIPLIEIADKITLANAIGKEETSVMAVLDQNFQNGIIKAAGYGLAELEE